MTEDLEQKLELAVAAVTEFCRLVELMEKMLLVVTQERDAAMAYIEASEAMKRAAA